MSKNKSKWQTGLYEETVQLVQVSQNNKLVRISEIDTPVQMTQNS